MSIVKNSREAFLGQVNGSTFPIWQMLIENVFKYQSEATICCEAFADTFFSLPPVEDFGLSSTSAENMEKLLKVFLILSLSAYNEEDLQTTT